MVKENGKGKQEREMARGQGREKGRTNGRKREKMKSSFF